MEDTQIDVPPSIASCVNEFLTSIRNEWNELAEPLARSLGEDQDFVRELINQLENLFVEKL